MDSGDYGNVAFDSNSAYGTANNWITYSAWPNRNSPHIDSMSLPDVGKSIDVYLKFYGLNFDPGYLESMQHAVNIGDSNYVIFDTCYFEASKVLGASGDFKPYVFGNDATIYTHYLDSPSHITITNCNFKYGYNGIRIVSAEMTNWKIFNNAFSQIADNSIQIGGTNNLLISGNEIHHGNKYHSAAYWGGTATGDWSNKQWETVTQDTTNASGIFYKLNDEGTRFYIFADDENNIPSRATSYTWRLDSDPIGVYWTPSGTGDDAHTDLISIEGESYNVVIEKNLLYETTGNGIKFALTGSNITLKNNIIYSEGGCLLYMASGTNIQVYNNVIDRGGDKPVWGMRILSGEPEIDVRNNIFSGVIYGNATITASNNIWAVTQDNLNDAFEDSNSFYGQDFDTLFVNRANGNYRLHPDSIAIDAGFDLTNLVPKDYLGISRPLDGDNSGTAKYDIGPYEYTDSENTISPSNPTDLQIR